ncbi:DUF7133 domain-containing protein [Fodinibius sediminis]|uniref:Glucose/arabinose dehydrogenase, beta-propeller fold n=1 Tax=Fodinibius sediminis TaxID=1214077 RepID=A0A521CSB3_9BACT|nr:hypothetical protein [Fodinibius sediminis]SMO62354.1 Glucose/arabinose dehydrogenase, beta-propeller fold [Fodinibius sediminis]
MQNPKIRAVFYFFFLISAGLTGCSKAGWPQEPEVSYRVENIPLPEGLSGEVGALDFMPDGRLIAAFRRGEVMTYHPESKKWTFFASGLQLPLGILAVNKSEVLVMQYAELTRLIDTDGDGRAEQYKKVADDFGISGNYHEFSYGPVRDEEGNLYIALNATSSGGRMRREVARGEINGLGFRSEGMYSAVPYRGWVMQLGPGGELRPYASGFRSPNGLGFDQQDRLLVTDNQGDWVGTSTLYNVRKNHFYGHPASLVWREGWARGKPAELPVEELDAMRTEAAVLFPHDIMANSPTQPLVDDTNGTFGPFSGQVLVGEMNRERIVRVMLEEVGGVLQGAAIPFMDGQGLRKGNNRMAFAPDGSLWVGQNASGWAGDQGIQRIVYTGKQPMDVHDINLTAKGFDLTFTKAVRDSTALRKSNYEVVSYFYKYHREYGSDRTDIKPIKINEVRSSEDSKRISLDIQPMQEGRVYQIRLENLISVTGDTLDNSLICYTVNKLKSRK